MKIISKYFCEIYDDEAGEFISFGPDRDGLGCVEIRQGDSSIIIPVEMARELAKVINNLYEGF